MTFKTECNEEEDKIKKMSECACLFPSSSVEVSVLGLLSTIVASPQLSIVPLPGKAARFAWAPLWWCSVWVPSLAAELGTIYNQNKKVILNLNNRFCSWDDTVFFIVRVLTVLKLLNWWGPVAPVWVFEIWLTNGSDEGKADEI
jgi:hypothetical protein